MFRLGIADQSAQTGLFEEEGLTEIGTKIEL